MKRVVVSALLGVTLLASTAHAQDQWERVVRSQLEQAGRISQERGFQMDHDIFQGRLDDDATTDLSVNLRAVSGLSDRGLIVTPGLAYAPSRNVQMSLDIVLLFGPDTAEYRLAPIKRAFQGRMKYFF